tara:strand:- start:293 stop:457 length:165 start_codon:yes stop_codon:yes gene_type:complete
MIKYLLFGVIFVLLVFFGLNFWEKTKKTKKNTLISAFTALIVISLGFLIYLLID